MDRGDGVPRQTSESLRHENAVRGMDGQPRSSAPRRASSRLNNRACLRVPTSRLTSKRLPGRATDHVIDPPYRTRFLLFGACASAPGQFLNELINASGLPLPTAPAPTPPRSPLRPRRARTGAPSPAAQVSIAPQFAPKKASVLRATKSTCVPVLGSDRVRLAIVHAVCSAEP